MEYIYSWLFSSQKALLNASTLESQNAFYLKLLPPLFSSKGVKGLSVLGCKFKCDSGWYLTAGSKSTL